MHFLPKTPSQASSMSVSSKIFSSIVFFVFIGSIAIAQNRKEIKTSNENTDSLKSRYEIGVAGGMNLNEFTKGQPQTGFNTGFNAGVLINYRFYKGLSLQVEANYLQQGGQMISFKDDTRIGLPESFSTKNVKNSSYKLNSLEVPLLVSYAITIKPSWVPSIYIGGSYVYTFNATESYQKTGNLLPGEDIIATANGKQTATSLFNTNRFNLITGADIKLPLTAKFKLLIDFRYLTGLTTAREDYSYMEKPGFGSDIRTNSFVTRIGIIMPLR